LAKELPDRAGNCPTLYAKITKNNVSKELNMTNLPYVLRIILLAFPLVFISKAFGQIGQYVKDQSWTNHYKTSLKMIITDRFRAIDFCTDLIISFLIYGEIFSRIHYEEPFVSNVLFGLLLIIFVFEKVLRTHLYGKIL